MTTWRQFEANRRNSLRSTGPRTEQGKQRSRQNATKHGLTAHTVVDVLEDPAAYRAFEIQVLADYLPASTIERELVTRLASLLWRLRRATAIETGLLQIHAEILSTLNGARNPDPRMLTRPLRRVRSRAPRRTGIGLSHPPAAIGRTPPRTCPPHRHR